MHCRQLVEVAALAVDQGPGLIASSERLSPAGLEQYWAASKARLDRWGRLLKAHAAPADPPLQRTPTTLRGVLEEIFISEILTRVWAAVLVAHDRTHQVAEAEPIGRSVLLGHVEARNRALNLLLHSTDLLAEDAVSLNRLRRRSERWADVLIGRLSVIHDVCDLAIDPDRARDFAEDHRQQRPGGEIGQAWSLQLVSLRSAFAQSLCSASPHGDLNERIAGSVLASFPPDLFDGTGLFRSLWLVRLSANTTDAQGLIEQLLGEPRDGRVLRNPPFSASDALRPRRRF